MEFRVLGPLEVVVEGRPVVDRVPASARPPRAPPAPRERGARVGADRRGAVGRGRPGQRGQDGGVPRLQAPRGPGARPSRGGDVRRRGDGAGRLRAPRRARPGRRRAVRAPRGGGPGATRRRPRGARERLAEALALWRGEPYADVAYEAFAQQEIRRLDELRLGALEDRIAADLACGDHGAVVGELERLVGEQPLRERARGQLMLALYRGGRQGDALRVYGEGRRLLSEELGIDPSPELQQLEACDPPPGRPARRDRPGAAGPPQPVQGAAAVRGGRQRGLLRPRGARRPAARAAGARRARRRPAGGRRPERERQVERRPGRSAARRPRRCAPGVGRLVDRGDAPRRPSLPRAPRGARGGRPPAAGARERPGATRPATAAACSPRSSRRGRRACSS